MDPPRLDARPTATSWESHLSAAKAWHEKLRAVKKRPKATLARRPQP